MDASFVRHCATKRDTVMRAQAPAQQAVDIGMQCLLLAHTRPL